MTYYIAIPDIHGEKEKLDKALADIDAWLDRKQHDGTIQPEDKIQFVFLGDYIDRGKDSKYVLAKVKEYVLDRGAICLLGNHDLFLIGTVDGTGVYFEEYGKSNSNLAMWENNGGLKTCREMFGSQFDQHFRETTDVASYIEVIKKSEEYNFLKEHGRRKYETDLIFFCHAQQSDAKDYNDTILLWGRTKDYGRPDSSFKVPANKAMSVHGHFHRLSEGITFPRIVNYIHGGKAKTVVMADCGCGCGWRGELHPVIIAESSKNDNGIADDIKIVAIL